MKTQCSKLRRLCLEEQKRELEGGGQHLPASEEVAGMVLGHWD